MWKKRITTSKQNVELVERNLHPTARLTPSESIYYGIYPYRIKLSMNAFQMEEMPQWRKSMFTYDLINLQIAVHLPPDKHRFRGNYPRSINSEQVYSLYVQDIDFVKEVCKLFDKSIVEIAGPISKDYLDILYTPNKFLSVREKYWYGKWDTAYTFWLPFKGRYGYGNKTKRVVLYENLRNHIIDLLPEEEYQFSPTKWIVKVFLNQKTGKDILPWIMLQHPEVEIREYMCIEIDK